MAPFRIIARYVLGKILTQKYANSVQSFGIVLHSRKDTAYGYYGERGSP